MLYHEDLRLLFAGYWNGKIKIFTCDMINHFYTRSATLLGSTGTVWSLALDDKNNTLYSICTGDKKLRMWTMSKYAWQSKTPDTSISQMQSPSGFQKLQYEATSTPTKCRNHNGWIPKNYDPDKPDKNLKRSLKDSAEDQKTNTMRENSMDRSFDYGSQYNLLETSHVSDASFVHEAEEVPSHENNTDNTILTAMITSDESSNNSNDTASHGNGANNTNNGTNTSRTKIRGNVRSLTRSGNVHGESLLDPSPSLEDRYQLIHNTNLS